MAHAVEKNESRGIQFPTLASMFPSLKAWTVGFDREWKMLEDLQDSIVSETPSYPPYNIEKLGECKYQIEMAVAGFDKNDLKVEISNDQLIIEGKKAIEEHSEKADYVYQGIASNHFRQTVALADHLKVIQSQFKNGILKIDLESEVLEAKKTKVIEIK